MSMQTMNLVNFYIQSDIRFQEGKAILNLHSSIDSFSLWVNCYDSVLESVKRLKLKKGSHVDLLVEITGKEIEGKVSISFKAVSIGISAFDNLVREAVEWRLSNANAEATKQTKKEEEGFYDMANMLDESPFD